MRRVSPFALSALAWMAAGSAARAADCRIDGEDLIRFAQSQGFASSAKRDGERPATDCRDNWPAVTISAPAAQEGRCRITYFEGARLTAAWKVRSHDFVGLPFTVLTRQGLELGVTAAAKAGESGNLSLRAVVLTGPRCADWREGVVAADAPPVPPPQPAPPDDDPPD